MVQRKRLKDFDIILLLAVLALFAFGLVAIYSATKGLAEGGGDPFFFVKRQIIAAVLGLVAMIVILRVDYRYIARLSRLIYLLTLVSLVAVFVIGRTSGGAGRWLSVGPLSIQPAEFAKISLILMLSLVLVDGERLQSWGGVLRALAYTAPPFVLVMLQPDLGTGLTLVGIVLGMLFFAGAPLKYLAVLTGGGFAAVVGAIVASINGWVTVLKPYQINRLLVFLDPYRYRHDEGWNVIQSMIAIGSGSFFGKGLFGGSQTQLNFLPARHTDFIFSVIGEEFGFIGGLIVLGLFAVVLWRGVRIMLAAKDMTGALLAAGFVTLLFVHVLINVGMTLGVMPITGLPLPLISYGGTSVMVTFIAVGLVLNVGLRRHKIRF